MTEIKLTEMLHSFLEEEGYSIIRDKHFLVFKAIDNPQKRFAIFDYGEYIIVGRQPFCPDQLMEMDPKDPEFFNIFRVFVRSCPVELTNPFDADAEFEKWYSTRF